LEDIGRTAARQGAIKIHSRAPPPSPHTTIATDRTTTATTTAAAATAAAKAFCALPSRRELIR